MISSMKQQSLVKICLVFIVILLIALLCSSANVAHAKTVKLKVTSVTYKNGKVTIKGTCPKKTTLQLSYSKHKIKKKFKGKRFVIKTKRINKPFDLKIRTIRKGKPFGKVIKIKKSRYVSKRPVFAWIEKFNNRDDRVLLQFEVKGKKGASVIVKQGPKKLKQKKIKSKSCFVSLTILSGSEKISVYAKQPGKMLSARREITIPNYLRNEAIFSNAMINTNMLEKMKANKTAIFDVAQYSKKRASKTEQYIYCEDDKLVALWDEAFGNTRNSIDALCKSGFEISILKDRVIYLLRDSTTKYELIYDWEYDFSYSQAAELKMEKIVPYWFYKEQ